MKIFKTASYEKIAGYNKRKKRDGTGPYKDSNQRKTQKGKKEDEVKGKRKQKGEDCPAKKDSDEK